MIKFRNLSPGQKLARENKQLFKDMLMHKALHPDTYSLVTAGNENLEVTELNEAQLLALSMLVVHQYLKKK